jgi:hypothetical protein
LNQVDLRRIVSRMADEHESKSVDSKLKYEELGRNYRVFLDWREKIVGGYVTIVGLLCRLL